MHYLTIVVHAILLPMSLALKLGKLGVDTDASDLLAPQAVPKQRLRVMSDFHIGGCLSRDKETQSKLVKFLMEMAEPNENNPTHLLLNGDLWDWWMVPLNEKTPAPQTLFKKTDSYGYNVSQIIDLIKQISKQSKVYLVRGNHDEMNTKEMTKEAFGDAVQFMEDGFEINGVWIEHGNIIDPYSTPPLKNGKKQMGYGYFEARAAADGWQCKKHTIMPDWQANIAKSTLWKDFLQVGNIFGKDSDFGTLANANALHFKDRFLKPLMEYSLPEHLGKKMNFTTWRSIPVKGFDPVTQKIKFNDDTETYTLGDAVADHEDDWKAVKEQLGQQHFEARFWASGEDHFKWVPMSQKHLVVVTSHNHDPTVQLMQRLNPEKSVSERVVRANSGAWTPDSYGRPHASYLDIDFQQRNDAILPTTVSYYEYPETTPRQQTAVPVPESGKTLGGFDLALHPIKAEMIVGEPQVM